MWLEIKKKRYYRGLRLNSKKLAGKLKIYMAKFWNLKI